MKKKTFVMILLLLLALGITAAAEVSEDGLFTYTVSNGEATITKVSRDAVGDVVLPAYLGGCPVTTLGERAFSHRIDGSVTSVTLPETMTTIEEYAMYWTLPQILIIEGTITYAGYGAVEGMGPKKIVIGDKATSLSFLKNLYIFSLDELIIGSGIKEIAPISNSLKTIKRLVLSEGVETVADKAFNAAEIGEAVLPSTLKSVGDNSFTGAAVELNTGVLPLEHIGKNAFKNCVFSSFFELDAPSVYVGSGAFENCPWLTGSINLSDEMTQIGSHTFAGCNYLESVSIPSSVTCISDCAFQGCGALKNITLPAELTEIGDYAFEQCVNLESISIPKTVKSIGDYAFSECVKLRTAEMQTGVASLGEGAFYLCMSLESIKLSDSIAVIEKYTFAGCRSLKSIGLPISLSNFSSSAFLYCTSLEKFTIHHLNSTFTTVSGVFYSKSKSMLLAVPANISDKSFVIPSSVTYIFSGAFANSSIEKLTIPKTVREISPSAFIASDMSLYFYKDSPAAEYIDSIQDADCFIIDGAKKGLYFNRSLVDAFGIKTAVVNDSAATLNGAVVRISQYSDGRLVKMLSIPIDGLAPQDKIMCETDDIEPGTEEVKIFLWDKNMQPLI